MNHIYPGAYELDELKYEKIGEVNGIDVELVQEAVTHYLYKSAYDLVQIFVPGNEVNRARELLDSFEEFHLED